MNDFDLCLEVNGHVNHCVTLATDYLGDR